MLEYFTSGYLLSQNSWKHNTSACCIFTASIIRGSVLTFSFRFLLLSPQLERFQLNTLNVSVVFDNENSFCLFSPAIAESCCKLNSSATSERIHHLDLTISQPTRKSATSRKRRGNTRPNVAI